MVFAFLAPLAPAVLAAAPALLQAGAVAIGSYVVGEEIVKPIFTPKAVEAEKLAQLPAQTQQVVAQKMDVSTIALILIGGVALIYLFRGK